MPLIRDTPTGELSPYLEQHRDNPVDWYPWGDEAFARAVELDRPIFLSVGYSACHWCHVMAHESFEDPVVAERLNASFVSVKVDREERPDVDAVYMEAVQAITGSGGWPMSVFLTPDRRPFYGGTYFPPTDHQGRPSFTTVLHALTDVWENRRAEVEEQADELATAISERSKITDPARCHLLVGLAGRWRPARPAHAGCHRPGRQVRPGVGRVRHRAEVPPADVGRRRTPPGGAARIRGGGRAAPGRRHADARRHGGRGYPRPPRRRLRPLRHRHGVAGAALREDALRPGRAAAGLPPRLAGDGRPVLPRRGRGDRLLRGA